jgi:hypothetical protein
MEIIGALFLFLALAVVVVLFIGQPFLKKTQNQLNDSEPAVQEREHRVSTLLAERDRILNALQELDFDYALGKVPPEDYPQQRAILLKAGADVLRELDEIEKAGGGLLDDSVQQGVVDDQVSSDPISVEDRIEAAVAARRADAATLGNSTHPQGTEMNVTGGKNGESKAKDELEEMIATRKRERKESAAGFCPHCGKPVQKSDKFCSKCGTTL